VCSNDLTRLAVGEETAAKINALNSGRAPEEVLGGLYDESFITDNVIADPHNHFVAPMWR
jgi:hypothetical protein